MPCKLLSVCALQQGVLTLRLGDLGTYVINKQVRSSGQKLGSGGSGGGCVGYRLLWSSQPRVFANAAFFRAVAGGPATSCLQTPNRQIWMSSPVSGPVRYDWGFGERLLMLHWVCCLPFPLASRACAYAPILRAQLNVLQQHSEVQLLPSQCSPVPLPFPVPSYHQASGCTTAMGTTCTRGCGTS